MKSLKVLYYLTIQIIITGVAKMCIGKVEYGKSRCSKLALKVREKSPEVIKE